MDVFSYNEGHLVVHWWAILVFGFLLPLWWAMLRSVTKNDDRTVTLEKKRYPNHPDDCGNPCCKGD